MSKERKTLNLQGDAWHKRRYASWLDLGGKKPKGRENLCHYVRVVLFWSWLRWLFSDVKTDFKIDGDRYYEKRTPPAFVAFLGLIVSCAVVGLVLWVVLALQSFLYALLAIIACAAGTAVLVLIAWIGDALWHAKGGRWRRFWTAVGHGIVNALAAVGRFAIRPLGYWAITPLTLVVAAVLVTLFVLSLPYSAIGLGVVAVIIAGVFAIRALASVLNRHLNARAAARPPKPKKPKPKKPEKVKPPKADGFLVTLRAWFHARHNGVCPFVDLGETL